MALVSGSYETKTTKKVVVWPAPDANGTGADVWENDVTSDGRVMGRKTVRDKYGNVVKLYPAPEGFKNIPTSDNKDCYVLVDERGEVVRQPNGEAVNISPGQAIVFEPDGTVTVLSDEYSQWLFNEAHATVTPTVVAEVKE